MKKFYAIVIHIVAVLSANHSFAQPKIVVTLRDWGSKGGGAVVRTDLPGMAPGLVYSFDNTSPHDPIVGVCAGDADWLYGVSSAGGSNSRGTFYRVHQDGTLLTTLYHFNNNFGFNTIPFYHTDAFVYFGDADYIRKYNTSNGSINGMQAGAIIESKNFVIDGNDWIYFIERAFPSRLVKMKTDGLSWTELHQFNAATEGEEGNVGVTEVPGDSLFGVMRSGGTNSGGTLYTIRKDGSGFAVRHQFDAASGMTPESKLVYFDGKVYGTTTVGGDYNKGVLFCIDADGSNYRVVHHFNIGDGTYTETPAGNIAISSDGKIFGSFRDWLYDNFNYYYLYKLDTSGSNFTPFFNGDNYNRQRTNGEFPQDILLFEDEDIFFPTRFYGKNDGGVMNHCDTTGIGSDLFHYGNSPNGFHPNALIKATDGKLYGSTIIGGPDGSGVLFSMNQDGTGYTRLHQFTDAEGYEPSGKLLEASDGKLYGACRYGGPANLGSIFRINKNGTGFQIIYDYTSSTAGYSPVGGLIEGPGGVLYGINFWAYGSVFKVNKDGTNYTELKIFDNIGTGLRNPYTGLQLSGNYLYGTCGYGGSANAGAIYRVRTDGSGYQVLHEFDGASEGSLPVGTPLIASNGKLYGATAYGGGDDLGYLYRIDTSGANFVVLRDMSNADGGNIWFSLILASDGTIYGAGFNGGTFSGGTLFKINGDGTGFTVIRNFNYDTEGSGVYSLLDLNGNFVLPVELLSFNAEKRLQTSLLTWKTAQEQNTDRFNIERSPNGLAFNFIGTIAAAGNSNSTRSYSFTDNDPVKGVNYYRLKQIDIDGSFTYSKVVSLNFGGSENVSVFPNPATDHLYIRIPANTQYKTIRIIDATGKIALQKDITSSAIIELNIRTLAKGWYISRLEGENSKVETIFLKQ